MTLLLDIGNTRIKWAVLQGSTLGEQRAQAHAGWDKTRFRQSTLDSAGMIRRVVVANVGGERIAQIAQDAVQETCGFAPEFVRTAPAAAGVRNAYVDHRKLGVDRWMSLIAAHALEQGACCVVNVGTAMTIDGIDAQGRHLGGVIVPGPDLMMSSLMRNTSDIAAHAQEGHEGAHLLADNTLGGVYQGAVHALAALVERVVRTMAAQLGETPVVLLSGGAHERLMPLIDVAVRPVPDLVLRGLAVMAQQK